MCSARRCSIVFRAKTLAIVSTRNYEHFSLAAISEETERSVHLGGAFSETQKNYSHHHPYL